MDTSTKIFFNIFMKDFQRCRSGEISPDDLAQAAKRLYEGCFSVDEFVFPIGSSAPSSDPTPSQTSSTVSPAPPTDHSNDLSPPFSLIESDDDDEEDFSPSPASSSASAPDPLGRRKRPQSRGPRLSPLHPSEMDRSGYGIPRDNSLSIRMFITSTFIPATGASSKRDLMEWCFGKAGSDCPALATRNPHISQFYDLVNEKCHNHFHSYEHRESSQSAIRTVLKSVGLT